MDSVYNFTSQFTQKMRKKPGKDINPKTFAFLGSLFLLLLAVIFGISISASLFHVPNMQSGLGDFFANSYGILAFIIPLYLICAAVLLLDSTYRPDRIFILNCTIFPFLTLAIGFSFIRDFAFFQETIEFISVIGRNGFSFLIIFLTVMECFVIASLSAILFPAPVKNRTKSQNAQAAPQGVANYTAKQEKNEIKLLRVPSSKKSAQPEEAFSAQFHETINPARYGQNSLNMVNLSSDNYSDQSLTDAGLKAVEEVYNKAFEELEEFDASTFEHISDLEFINEDVNAVEEFEAPTILLDAIDATDDIDAIDDIDVIGANNDDVGIDTALKNLDPGLETLNAKLQSLDSDLGEIDMKFEKLDLNIETLKNELNPYACNHDRISKVEEFSEIDAVNEIDVIDEINEIDEIDEIEEAEEVTDPVIDVFASEPTFSASVADSTPDFEELINAAEMAAAENTAEVIKKKDALKSETIMPTKKSRQYKVPVEILKEYADGQYWIIDEATRQAATILKGTLNEFKIQAEVTGIRKGPVITMFEILPSPGVKLSKIVNLQDNIALRLAASSVRIVAPIPGKHAVGIEIPNKKRNIVSFREIIEGEMQREGKKAAIPVVLGKDITGEAVTVDLATMPHLLIAGSTGSGKSVCVNTMILSILYQCHPSDCRLILIDPKIVELKLYNDIPHLLTPVITEPKRAFQALQYCIYEMERRYACLDSMGVRDIKTYNKRIKERNIATEKMPYIVIVIDEFADLMATTGKELESTVARLAAMSRAVGIHLVLATQRPSIDVITGLIKSNIPSRIAFMVASMMDSRIIIDATGAEKLLGKGDMLYSGVVDPFPIRMQGAFVSEEEVEAVVDHVKTLGEPDYIDEEIFFEDDDEETAKNVYTEGDDPLYEKALEVVVQQGKASASYIQRRLKIGYNRAARLVEEMEQRGVVGPAQGSRPRELLRAV